MASSANNTKFNVKDALEDLGAPPLIAPSSSSHNNNADSGGAAPPPPPALVTSKVVATLSTIASLNNTKVVPLEVMKRMVHMMLDETITSRLIHSSLLVAIGHLATFERSRMLLGDSTECIAALCSHRFLEQFNSPNIQSGTLEALWQLVQSYRKNQEKLAKQNNLVALIAIIQREAEKNRNKASQLLDLLVTQESCAHSLVQSESFMEATSICVEVKHTEQWAAQFYHHLSEHKECCRAIVEFATVDALVELLKRGLFYDNVAYRKMCIHVLRTLHNVTLLDNRCRASLTSAIPCLIQYIRTRSHLLTMGKVSEATEKNVQNCEGRELCCKILANITEELPEEKLAYSSHNRANRDKLRRNKLKVVNCNGLPVLCHLMKGLAEQSTGVDPSQLSPEFIAHSSAVQKLAIKIVANVASIEENVLKMLGLEVYNDERDDFLDADELRDNLDEIDRNDDVDEDGLEDIQPPEELLEDIARENAKNEEQELQEQQEQQQQQQSQPPPPATPATKPTTPATPATPARPTPPAPAIPSKSTAPPAPATPTAPTSAAPAPPSEAEATSETTDDAVPEIKQVDAQTLEQLREQMKDGLFLTNLLLDLLIGCKDADKRQHVISAISAFAIHPKCANQLVDLGVIARLLEMIQSKVESNVIASLFASMNVHDSFQKKLYSIGGLKPLINLLNQKATQAELEAGLIAVGPFVRTPNGRMILKKEGVLQRLKELLKQTDNSDQVILLAKEILRVLKTESDATMYALTGENTGDDMVNYDEIFRIARDFVQVTQSSIQKLMNRRHIRVHVNWRKLEKQKEIASEAMGLLSREALWDGIVFATEIFINSSPGNLLAFQNNVAMIILEVNDSEDSKDYCEVKIENLIMRYRIAQTGRLLTPKSLAAEISMEIYDEDVTGYNADEEEQDEAYQLAVETLKKVTSDSRIPLIGDLNALYFHLETAISLWKPNFQENQGFIAAKNAVMDHNELFLKGWKIVKFNKDGMRQERLLLLTDKCYYTVHFDYNIRKIDYKHSKQHNLEDYFLIDIGKLRDNKDDDPTLDWARPYALSLVTKEKAHSKSKVAEEADEDFETTTASEVDDDEDLLTSTDMMSSGHGSDDEMTASQAVIDVENAIMGGNEEEDERITRPSTKGKYSSVFVAPNSIAPNMQQSYIEEIALCIYAAAAAYRREEIFPPFRRAIKKPGSNSLKAKLYNTFFGSKTVDTTVPRGNSGNKLATPASSDTEQKQNMRDILAKRKNIK